MVLRDINEKIQDPRLSILKVMHEVVFCLGTVRLLRGQLILSATGWAGSVASYHQFYVKVV